MLILLQLRVIVLIIFTLLYWVLPVDLLPEALFGAVGLLDDAFVGLMLLLYCISIYRETLVAAARPR